MDQFPYLKMYNVGDRAAELAGLPGGPDGKEVTLSLLIRARSKESLSQTLSQCNQSMRASDCDCQ